MESILLLYIKCNIIISLCTGILYIFCGEKKLKDLTAMLEALRLHGIGA